MRWRVQSRQVLPFAFSLLRCSSELQPFAYWSKRSPTATTVIHNCFSATWVDFVYSPNSQTKVIHQVKRRQSARCSFEADRTDIPNSLSTFGHSCSPGGTLLWARNCRLLEVIYLFSLQQERRFHIVHFLQRHFTAPVIRPSLPGTSVFIACCVDGSDSCV